MPEPPAWFNRFLQMHMPPWFQMPPHASSLEFLSKGQFPKLGPGKWGKFYVVVKADEGICVQFMQWF